MRKINCVKLPGRKGAAVLTALAIMLTVCVTAVVVADNKGSVEFAVLDDKNIPHEISSEVIPEYRSLERALACMVDGKVYVLVTRGEKPASGYKVDIKKMKLEEERGKQLLVVYADFCDPDTGKSISHVLSYPLKVAETELKRLPDDIELRVQYRE